MAGKIPPEFVDQLLSRIDVVDIIDSRVRLKKAGKDYQALCPFHSEKSPSFTVSQDKQFYHCFGCGAHGSAIGFLMEYEHMSFPEAIEDLAKHAGMEVPRNAASGNRPDLEPMLQLMERTAGYYQQQLRSHPQAQRAVDYLKQRGLTGKIASEYALGYAPPGWRALLDELGGEREATRRLVEAGMAVERADTCYDRFRDRIMFPIRNRRGQTIGFGGRVLGDDKPKYLNSPETPLFHKGRELYGLYEARKALRRIDRLLIVEGYMDVIALAQFDIRYAVATLGTATTADHLDILFRTCQELVFCFDGDRAGRDAAWKALNTALPQAREGREIRFLFLPDGEDPDTLIRKIGTDAFAQRIKEAPHLSDFLFEHLSMEIDMNSLDGRAHLAELAKPLLTKLPAGVYREMMSKRLADIVGLPSNRLGIQPAPPRPARRALRPASSKQVTPVRWAIAVLLQHPELGAGLREQDAHWRTLQNPGVPLLEQLLELTQSQPTLSTAALIERWRDSDYFAPLNKLAQYDLSGAEAGPEQELNDAFRRLNQQAREQEQERLYSNGASPKNMTEEEKSRLRELFSRQRTDDSTNT